MLMASANFSRSVLSRSAAESPAEGKGSESKKKMGFGSKIRVPLLGKSKKVKKVGKLTEENLMRHTVDLHSPLEHRAMLQQHIDRHNDFLLQNQFQNPPPILQQYDDDDAVTPLTRELPVDVPKPHATHNGTSPYENTTKTPDKPTPVIAIPPRPTDHGAPRDGRKKRPSPPPPPPSTVEAVGTPTRTPTSSRNNCDSIAADLSSVCVSKKSFSRENSLNCGLDKSEDDKNSSGDLLSEEDGFHRSLDHFKPKRQSSFRRILLEGMSRASSMSLDKLEAADDSTGFQKPNFTQGSQSFLNNAFDSSPDTSAFKEIRNVIGTPPTEGPNTPEDDLKSPPFGRERASSAPNLPGNIQKLLASSPQRPNLAKSEHSINQMPPDFGNLKKAPGLNPIAEERENVAPKTKKKRRTERCLSVDASSRNKAKKAKKKALGSEQIDNQQRSQSLDNLAGGEEVAADPASRTTSSNGEKGKEGSKKSKRGRKKSKPTPSAAPSSNAVPAQRVTTFGVEVDERRSSPVAPVQSAPPAPVNPAPATTAVLASAPKFLRPENLIERDLRLLQDYDRPMMLAKATRAIQDHVRDVKTNCCTQNKKEAPPRHTPDKNHNGHVLVPPTKPINPHVRGSTPIRASENNHYIIDMTSGTTYLKGKLLGKGGFAKCYEMTDIKSNVSYAGKIISKNRLNKPHQKEKILREIELHRSLRNAHVVAFHSYFEDDDNVYIILEVCRKKSLVHVLKNRKTLTEPEVRFHMKHLIEGTRYIHRERVIHRDLKLGNMLLNDVMQVKIADFGLATRVEYDGELKMTVCGTPNYIAPEVLQKKGHSYEADVWAMGCVMYAMLVGRPPFETATLKETYLRITSNKYHIPPHLSPTASALIRRFLHPDPHKRPKLDKVLQDDFFVTGFMPKKLASSCTDTAPTFPTVPPPSANPVSQFAAKDSRPRSYAAPVTSSNEAMSVITSSLAHLKVSKKSASQIITRSKTPEADAMHNRGSGPGEEAKLSPAKHHSGSTPANMHRQGATQEVKGLQNGSAVRLYQLLSTCLSHMPREEQHQMTPVDQKRPLWVTKWVDYTNKYGFGFQLSDRSVGILFNDTTRLLLTSDGSTAQYNDLSNKVFTFNAHSAPHEYEKKVKLLMYFAQYMDEHLIHGGDMLNHRQQEPKEPPSGIFMKKWFRTDRAIVMFMNSGTLQVNFFEDHTKVILSADKEDYTLTYVNNNRSATNYKLSQIRCFGTTAVISERLNYARCMLEKIINIQGEAV